ncbi:MAG: epoxyqueuosine reductase QueH [Christensenellaceae bacterium]|jgi:predicted adenine nucleotide alpha hydrolase (AANH) superfamily ATPase|nr:epoxyqueuosine reductase QueH [Christensenellaceae bacterium]
MNEKDKILLSACCGPCATVAIERLAENFDVSALFVGDNLATIEEFEKRKAAFITVCEFFKVPYDILPYNPEAFLEFVAGFENAKEGGGRCALCFEYRMTKTEEYALNNGIKKFTTSLTTSPHKNAELIAEIGASFNGYLHFDFKSENGFARSVQISKQLNIYRQNFCGCQFSVR